MNSPNPARRKLSTAPSNLPFADLFAHHVETHETGHGIIHRLAQYTQTNC